MRSARSGCVPRWKMLLCFISKINSEIQARRCGEGILYLVYDNVYWKWFPNADRNLYVRSIQICFKIYLELINVSLLVTDLFFSIQRRVGEVWRRSLDDSKNTALLNICKLRGEAHTFHWDSFFEHYYSMWVFHEHDSKTSSCHVMYASSMASRG